MQTDVAPASVRDMAMGICRRHGLGLLSTQRRLDEAGDTAFTDAIIALEAAFGIHIEMDEIWHGATTPDLIALVEAKASDIHRLALWPANDGAPGRIIFPAEPAPWVRRHPIVGTPPLAHAVRAQRIANRASNWREVRAMGLRMLQVAALAGSGAGVLAFLLIAPR